MSTLKQGLLLDPKITQKVFSGIEHGSLSKVDTLVIHQTGASTAQQTFNSYAKGGHGAHFLIDKKGAIYQTARVTQKAYHVGKIKSKCYETKACTKVQLQNATQMLFQKGLSYSSRITNLHHHEKAKPYPDRYPLNSDSLGIEIVGSYDKLKKQYEAISPLQNSSLKWLISELYTHFNITSADVYRHPEVSYKMPTEASSATW